MNICSNTVYIKTVHIYIKKTKNNIIMIIK